MEKPLSPRMEHIFRVTFYESYRIPYWVGMTRLTANDKKCLTIPILRLEVKTRGHD